jgi:hypothetical protein
METNNVPLEFLDEILSRLLTIRDGWEHKSKWNNKLGSTFLDLYIEDYKQRIDTLLNK